MTADQIKNLPRTTILQGDNMELLKSLPDNSVDAIVTDPPYGLGKEPDPAPLLRDWLDHGYHEIKGRGFAGKEWDAFVPQPALWKECLRVLKPGGHLLSFFGTRTYDWGVLALRLAGFEIRDQLAWLYGSGFPKNLDVAKAIDAADAPGKQRERQLKFTAWMRSTGLTAKQINQATGTNMAGHYLTDKEQPAIATLEHLDKLRPLLKDVPAWVEEMAKERSAGSDNLKKREPVGVRVQNKTVMRAIGQEGENVWYTETAAYTEAAKEYEGWGTALKPAQEPIVLARKPFKGNVAENVLSHGTGALNIDGCRVPTDDVLEAGSGGLWSHERDGKTPQAPIWKKAKGSVNEGLNGAFLKNKGDIDREGNEGGRYPANIIHDGSPEVLELLPDTESGSGNKNAGTSNAGGSTFTGLGANRGEGPGIGGDKGSAARYFYCAKATRRDRDEGLDWFKLRKSVETRGGEIKAKRNTHPTVKPTRLMSYLVRLITPKGGVVLDPFAGSGSTGKGAILEGFKVILMEREAEYIPFIKARTSFAEDVYDKANRSAKFSALQLALLLDDDQEIKTA